MRAVLIALLLATPAAAAERRLTGEEVRAVHSDASAVQMLSPDDEAAGVFPWRQDFFADGRTVYHDPGDGKPVPPSEGRWDVWGNRYCSTWGASGLWDCYNVYLDEDGPRTIIIWEGVDGAGNPVGGRFEAVIETW